ncbi:MAG: EpsG family protein [Oscillospiraceae bacterium]|nr:EpsG family protein [Oscillospiraceae bacterium]
MFIVIASSRFQVGYDFNSYGGAYFNMKYMSLEEICESKMEKGFLMPLYILNLAFENYRTVFIYTSIIIYASVFYLIYKHSSYPWISTAAYMCFGLFFNSLCFLRQVMAALLVTYAVQFVCEKRPMRFLLLIIAASTFHWSAIFMVVMYLLLRIKPSYIYLGVMTAGMIIFLIFSRSVMLWAVGKFYMYSAYNPETSSEASVGLPMRYTVMFGVLFVVCFVFRKQLIEKRHSNAVYINCLMYTVVFEAMGMRHGILSRFAVLVYLPAILYLLPDTAVVVKEFISEKISDVKRRQLAYIGAVAASSVFSAVCFFILMINNYNGTVPYISYNNRPYDIFVESLLEEGTDDFDEDDFEDDDYDSFTEDDEDTENYDDSEDFDEEAFENEILNQLEGL